MTPTELIDKWQARLTAMRDERDFLIKHNFKVEAMAQDKAIQALWDILDDLKTAAPPGDIMRKPDGRFKCLVCGSEWGGQSLFLEPGSVRWTCGDPFCGGTVVEIETAVHKQNETEKSLRTALSEVVAGNVRPISELWDDIGSNHEHKK